MNLNKNQYRSVDLTIFAILTALFEAINILAIKQWFPEQMFSVSLLVPLVALVIMRWGGFAILHALLSGFVFCFFQSAQFDQYVVYMAGNCFSLLIMLLFLAVNKEKIRTSAILSILYVLSIYLLVSLGKTIVSLCFGEQITVFFHYSFADALSAVIGVVIVLVARRQDGLFEDQIHYLRRLQQEKEQQRKLKDQGMQ